MKTSKILLIILGCILIASAIFMAGFSIARFGAFNIGADSDYQMKNFTSQENVKGIIIDEKNQAIELKKSNDDKVHITYYENKNVNYEIEQSSDGILSVIKKNTYKWYDYILNFDIRFRDLLIEIPAGFNGNLTVDNSNAGISVLGINADTVSLSTSNGKISMTDVEGNNIDARTSNAMIELEGVNSQNDIKAKTSNGQIRFKNIDFKNALDFNTSNASIKGEIKGKMSDYSIRSKTSNGNNNLPDNTSGGAKTIDIETSNSSIEVSFTG